MQSYQVHPHLCTPKLYLLVRIQQRMNLLLKDENALFTYKSKNCRQFN
jgi:hypothetical protein